MDKQSKTYNLLNEPYDLTHFNDENDNAFIYSDIHDCNLNNDLKTSNNLTIVSEREASVNGTQINFKNIDCHFGESVINPALSTQHFETLNYKIEEGNLGSYLFENEKLEINQFPVNSEHSLQELNDISTAFCQNSFEDKSTLLPENSFQDSICFGTNEKPDGLNKWLLEDQENSWHEFGDYACKSPFETQPQSNLTGSTYIIQGSFISSNEIKPEIENSFDVDFCDWVSDSKEDLELDLWILEYSIDSHFINESRNNFSWLHEYGHNSQSQLTKVLDSTSLISEKWDKINQIYETFKNNWLEYLHDDFKDFVQQYFDFDQLFNSLQSQFTRVKEKFSRLLKYTNKLSQLLFESVSIEDQRLVFRKIYGFLFKNLDDESHNARKLTGVRKQPQIAFINQINIFNTTCRRYVQRRINSGFKKYIRWSRTD